LLSLDAVGRDIQLAMPKKRLGTNLSSPGRGGGESVIWVCDGGAYGVEGTTYHLPEASTRTHFSKQLFFTFLAGITVFS
jgi:hypothetical protein